MFQTQHPTVEWQRKKEKCFHYVRYCNSNPRADNCMIKGTSASEI